MSNIYKTPRLQVSNYGIPMVSIKQPQDFIYLIGMGIGDIILFDNGTDELLEQGRTILPRHYIIFVGNKDGELQYKPYEYNQYRIVVSTYKDIITEILSIG